MSRLGAVISNRARKTRRRGSNESCNRINAEGNGSHCSRRTSEMGPGREGKEEESKRGVE